MLKFCEILEFVEFCNTITLDIAAAYATAFYYLHLPAARSKALQLPWLAFSTFPSLEILEHIASEVVAIMVVK